MKADSHAGGLVAGTLVRRTAVRPAAPGRPADGAPPPPPLAPAERAAEILRFRDAVAASIADLDRIGAHQRTVGARQWVDDRRRALQTDAWTNRVAYLIDREGLPAGAAVARACAWLRTLAVPVVEAGALAEVDAWLQLRFYGPEAPLPPRSVLGLPRVGSADLLLLDLLAPTAIVAPVVAFGDLTLWLPLVEAPLPPQGQQVVVDLAAGAVSGGSLPGVLPVVEPALMLSRWEGVALLAYGPKGAPAAGEAPIGINLDQFLRKPLHPGALHLLAAVVRRAPVAIGGQAAYDPTLLPLWWGMGVRAWFDPPEDAPDRVDPGRAREAWKAAAQCRTAPDLRSVLTALQKRSHQRP